MPYSTTHYFCGCHIVESKAKEVDLCESTFCGQEQLSRRCRYLPVLQQYLAELKRKREETNGQG